jgi:flavin reductase (DIM6/NTAB) family NADH-FMN oxidoreductase RutF
MKQSMGARTLIYPTPVWIVGTYDSAGKPNGMTVAWGGICCSRPPSIAVSLRKATYSFGSIVERKAFTVNVPSDKHVAEADYFGITSGRDVDKFAACGLTPIRSELVDAPYVDEFPLVLECKLIHSTEIGLHTQFIGEILDVKIDQSCLDGEGKAGMSLVRPIMYEAGGARYFDLGSQIGKGYSIGKKFMSNG